MKAIVTGGAGFIGSHLVDALLAASYEVVVLDNYSTGRPQNLAHASANPALRIIQCDIVSDDITPHFKGVDHVFHLAALADIVPSVQNPLVYHRANVDGTVAVLEAARNSGVKKLVYAASSSCYGIPDEYPTPESAPARPQYPYALTKWVAEQYVLHWGTLYRMPVASLRLFNVYGPRSRTSGTYGAVFGVFLAQKIAGKPYTVVGDGEQTRDFVFVTDVAAAFLAAAQSPASDMVINIGTGKAQSINSLVKMLGGEVIYVPKRPGEPDCTLADAQRAKKLLEWTPRVSFEQGVREMLANIDYWREAPVWTPDTISAATSDWFKYLGRHD